jgi:hypothetical protein
VGNELAITGVAVLYLALAAAGDAAAVDEACWFGGDATRGTPGATPLILMHITRCCAIMEVTWNNRYDGMRGHVM